MNIFNVLFITILIQFHSNGESKTQNNQHTAQHTQVYTLQSTHTSSHTQPSKHIRSNHNNGHIVNAWHVRTINTFFIRPFQPAKRKSGIKMHFLLWLFHTRASTEHECASRYQIWIDWWQIYFFNGISSTQLIRAKVRLNTFFSISYFRSYAIRKFLKSFFLSGDMNPTGFCDNLLEASASDEAMCAYVECHTKSVVDTINSQMWRPICGDVMCVFFAFRCSRRFSIVFNFVHISQLISIIVF